MKKVINGKRYDTDTATLIAEWDNGQYGKFEYCAERLYRKSTGEFFLYGEGGALSKYVVYSGNEQNGGEKITPLSYEEAQKWVEEYCDGSKYEEIFGAVNEDDEKRTVAIRLTPSAIAKLKNAAAQQGKSLSDIIETLIQAL